MENWVWQYIREQKLIGEGQDIGAAVSGGPDSMALLVCLCSLATQHGFRVVCIHFEHGIRGESSLRDAEFVEAYCDERDIPLFMGAADVPALAAEWGIGEESAAKRAREEYMNSLVQAGYVQCIATGHHLDDSAESVLMHILRGSGLCGLAGIHSRYGNFVRPLLCTNRNAILDYLHTNSIPYVQDETNSDCRYTRNYVRNVLLPGIEEHINPNVSAALNRLSVLAEQDSGFIEQQATEAFQTLAEKTSETVRMDAARLADLHPAIAGRVVRKACHSLYVVQDIELQHVNAVLNLARTGRTGARVNLSRSLYAELEYGTLILGFTGREVNYSFEIPFDCGNVNRLPDGDYMVCTVVESYNPDNRNPYCECFDADKLPQNMVLRTRHAGDAIRPLAGSGGKKLKDYFIDKKLPRDQRNQIPLLAAGSEIIWVVGHVISDSYKVDSATCRILEIEYVKRG